MPSTFFKIYIFWGSFTDISATFCTAPTYKQLKTAAQCKDAADTLGYKWDGAMAENSYPDGCKIIMRKKIVYFNIGVKNFDPTGTFDREKSICLRNSFFLNTSLFFFCFQNRFDKTEDILMAKSTGAQKSCISILV